MRVFLATEPITPHDAELRELVVRQRQSEVSSKDERVLLWEQHIRRLLEQRWEERKQIAALFAVDVHRVLDHAHALGIIESGDGNSVFANLASRGALHEAVYQLEAWAWRA
jgi:hypothetical protein